MKALFILILLLPVQSYSYHVAQKFWNDKCLEMVTELVQDAEMLGKMKSQSDVSSSELAEVNARIDRIKRSILMTCSMDMSQLSMGQPQ